MFLSFVPLFFWNSDFSGQLAGRVLSFHKRLHAQVFACFWGNFHYNNADPMKERTSRHIGFTSSDSTDGLLSSFLALLAENLYKFFNNFHSQKYLSLFRKNRDAVWFYQVSYKSKRFNNPTILQTFVQYSKFKEIDCKDKIA